MYEIEKIGDDYFTFLVKCKDQKACTILLRGASKDILNEVERNLQDTMNVTRNVMVNPHLVPGGGATEMALAQALNEKAKSITGIHQWPYRYLRLYGVRHMVKDHSDSEKGNPLPPHRLLLSINSKGSFICTIPQTG